MTARPAIRTPQPDDLDRAFYEASVKAGRLAIQHCRDCGQWTHPARYYCPNCTSENFEFRATSGDASVHSWTVSHVSADSAWKDRVPFVTIVAKLAEGPRVLAGTTTIGPDEISLSMPVALEVEVVTPDFCFVWANRPRDDA